MSFDRFFKLALLLLLLGFLVLGWSMRETGRYVYHSDPGEALSHVIDSQTGAVFEFNELHGGVEYRPQTGELITRHMWERGSGK